MLVAIGRQPYNDSLNLDAAQVACDDKGFIQINQQCQTNQPHIYAIGDCAGGMMLAHKASYEAKVAVKAACGQSSSSDALVPAVIFTDPEVASVGLTEQAAKEHGRDIRVASFPLSALGRSLAVGQKEGLVKLVTDPDGALLGVHLVGGPATDMIGSAVLALELGTHVDDLALTMMPHPTFIEGLHDAAEEWLRHKNDGK